jgi:hypothetical protein
MEQTKGYLRLEGKIWGINNKKVYENDTKRSLSFGLQTAKDNSLFVQVGDWKNSTLNTKVKVDPNGEVEELNEQDAIDNIKDNFKDGESVYINCRVDVDTYHKKINYLIGDIYKKSEAIDFDSAEFEEVNELVQSVVVTEKPEGSTVKLGVANYKGAMVELVAKLNDKDVKDYFIENVKLGDLMKITLRVVRKPIYEDKGEVTERKTLKGKVIKTGGRTISGYEEFIEVVDVDPAKTTREKYDRNDITEALASAEYKKSTNSASDTKVEEEELPY